MVLVGQPPPDESINIPHGVSLFDGVGKTIKATQGGKTNPTEDIPRYVRMHQAGLLNVDKIITHYFSLKDINKALDVLRSGAAGRIMIKMGDK